MKRERKKLHNFKYLALSLTVVVGIIFIVFFISINDKYNFVITSTPNKEYRYENHNKELGAEFFRNDSEEHIYTLADSENNASIALYTSGTKRQSVTEESNNGGNIDNIQLTTDIPDTVFSYHIIEHGIKEEIVLKSPTAILRDPLVFSFALKLENLTYHKDKSGLVSPSFYHKKDHVVYTLQPPFIYDAAGARTYKVGMQIREIANNVLAIEIIPDSDWMKDPARKFPITIDPTLVKGNAPLGEWNFDEGAGSTANDTSGNGNSLTVNNAAWQNNNDSGNPSSTYLSFDGTGDYLRGYSTDFDFGTASFSVKGWFRHNSKAPTSGTHILMARYQSAGWKIYMNTSGFMCFGVDDDASWGPDASVCTTSSLGSLADSRWHHVLAVKTGTSSISIYIDGNLINTLASGIPTGPLN